MQKTKVDININDFPQELHYIFADTNVYDSSSSPEAQVLYSDLGYYIKIADAMKYLHDQPIEGVLVSTSMKVYDSSEKGMKLKKDTFIPGDFCLPTIMLENWKFTSFIDVGATGVGDKHIDIYWALWSLQYNLKTDEYTDYFLDCYGREKVDMDILKIVAEVET